MSLISVSNLQKKFNLEAGFFAGFGRFVYAVRDLDFSIGENESYGLVGESGCGKTTTARLLVRMYDSDGGTIRFEDVDVRSLKGRKLKAYREKVRYVFQDPARSLNPRMTVYEVLVSGYRWAGHWPGEREGRREAAAILEEVGLEAADLDRRPSEFSGGQRQRISIARGLLMRPRLLICDEVVSALDVSIQGQILNLLLDIRERHKLAFLFIAHDLKVACYFCDRIGVMYRGELMEEAPAADLYESARHPYTKLLFSSAGGLAAVGGSAGGPAGDLVGGGNAALPAALPAAGGGGGDRVILAGEVKKVSAGLTGCAFADRCPHSTDRCVRERPPLREAGGPMREAWGGRRFRCFIDA